MYSKIEGQREPFKRIELTSDLAIILIITKTETGIKEVYMCFSDLPNHYPFRSLIFSKIFILSNFVCGNKDFLNRMTLILLSIYDHYQVIISLIFNDTTNVYKTITEAISDEQLSTFICTPGSSQNSKTFARFKNPKPVIIKNHDRKSQMTTIFLKIDDELWNIKSKNYMLTTITYENDTEKLEKWEEVRFLSLKVNEICIHWMPLQQPSSI